MASKYHVSADGTVRKCTAKTPESCRAKKAEGLDRQHFDSVESGSKAYENSQKANQFSTLRVAASDRIITTKELDERIAKKVEKKLKDTIRVFSKNKNYGSQDIEIAQSKAEKLEMEAKLQKLNNEFRNNYQNNQDNFDDAFLKSSPKRLAETMKENNALIKEYKEKFIDTADYRDTSHSYPLDQYMSNLSDAVQKPLEVSLRIKNRELGLMNKAFTNKEEQRNEVAKKAAIDYIKTIYDPKYPSHVQDDLQSKLFYRNSGSYYDYKRKRLESGANNASQFMEKFMTKESSFGEKDNIVLLKLSESHLKSDKDYVHFTNVDFTGHEEDREELSSIYLKMNKIESKMKEYNAMLKRSGEEVDPEVIESVRSVYKDGESRGRLILDKVKKLNRVQQEMNDSQNRSKPHGESKLDKIELDLFHTAKSTGF